jgi:hypothetical protein
MKLSARDTQWTLSSERSDEALIMGNMPTASLEAHWNIIIAVI